jgi:hypothetical protein
MSAAYRDVTIDQALKIAQRVRSERRLEFARQVGEALAIVALFVGGGLLVRAALIWVAR